MPVPRLILASRSPRRADLLVRAGFVFEQFDPPYHDPPQPQTVDDHTPQQLAERLARLKAESLRDVLAQQDHQPSVILAADTICVGVDARLIGQPQSVEEARETLVGFMNHRHPVVTGVALLEVDTGKLVVFSDTANVAFGQLDDSLLDAYLDSGDWRGKAGGYNLFDRQAAGWPVRCDADADPTTVVGLPMRRLAPLLEQFGVIARSRSSAKPFNTR